MFDIPEIPAVLDVPDDVRTVAQELQQLRQSIEERAQAYSVLHAYSQTIDARVSLDGRLEADGSVFGQLGQGEFVLRVLAMQFCRRVRGYCNHVANLVSQRIHAGSEDVADLASCREQMLLISRMADDRLAKIQADFNHSKSRQLQLV